MKNEIVIVLSSDRNYASLMGVMMYSIVKHNPEQTIVFYILDDRILDTQKSIVLDFLESENVSIHFLDCTDIRSFLQQHISCKVRAYAMYYRLFLADLLPQKYEKALYFDCDGLVVSDLTELWNSNITDYQIAGVVDLDTSKFKAKVGMKQTDSYMNSGMLLINLKRWREENLKYQFISFLDAYQGNVFHHDQGIINAVCKKKFVLPLRNNVITPLFVIPYHDLVRFCNATCDNYYSKFNVELAKKDPLFLHFVPYIVGRPWEKNNYHPLTQLYRQHQNETPWRNHLFSSKFNGISSVLKEMHHFLPFSMYCYLTSFFIKVKRFFVSHDENINV